MDEMAHAWRDYREDVPAALAREALVHRVPGGRLP